jgi:hypothetical protein
LASGTVELRAWRSLGWQSDGEGGWGVVVGAWWKGTK